MRLIDANALKEALNTWDKFGYTAKSELIRLTPDNEKLYRPYVSFEDVINCIDSAPTVETDIEVVAKDAYEHGYTDGWKERFGEPDGRQKGEWVIGSEYDCFSHIEKTYTCPFCNHRYYTKYPFCTCGADMRGTEE